MRIFNVEVHGFAPAIRGARNPKDSWDKSDSYIDSEGQFVLGEADKVLAQTLTKAGSEHCKFLRTIQVWYDIEAPRYMWSELDTYHYHTSNSCSTMHTGHKRFLTQEDFQQPILPTTLQYLNELIESRKNMEITAHEFIHEFKNELPEGFLQRRTINTNYAQLLNQYFQRKNHRLDVWREYCQWILTLPNFKELTGVEDASTN